MIHLGVTLDETQTTISDVTRRRLSTLNGAFASLGMVQMDQCLMNDVIRNQQDLLLIFRRAAIRQKGQEASDGQT